MDGGGIGTAFGGVSFALAILVGAAGIAKIVSPRAAGDAIALLPVPGRSLLGRAGPVRAIGIGEVLVAGWMIVVGDLAAAIAMACCYLAFTLVTMLLLQRAPGSADCGCFGRARSPLSRIHLAANIGFLVAAGVTVALPPGPLMTAIGTQPAAGAPLLALVALLAVIGYLLVTALPALALARRRLERT